jgi:hypothetical protein
MDEILAHFLLEPPGVELRWLSTSVQLAVALDRSLEHSFSALLEVIQLEVINDTDEVANIRLLCTLENMVISG